MIPSVNNILNTEMTIETQPSKNHKMHIGKDFINGKCDTIEAMKQVIYKILNTERYQHIIYSWGYGVQTIDLYGEPVTYVCPELERRITEALTCDDRIDSCNNFIFNTSLKGVVKVNFTVHTIFGDVNADKVVNI